VLPLITELLNILSQAPIVQSVRVIEYDETVYGKFLLRIRCRLPLGCSLQIWIHQEQTLRRYAYQLFTDKPILRWDNAPHHPELERFPHHFHDEVGRKLPSALTGNPLFDVPRVLDEVTKFLEKMT